MSLCGALRRVVLFAISGLALAASGCGANGAKAASSPAPAPAPQAAIQPASVTLASGQSQTFTAIFSGAAPPAVVWGATGGTITAGGDYVAGSAPGVFIVTLSLAASAPGAAPLAAAAVSISAPPPPTPPAASRLFPSPAADWLYSAPTGAGLDISSITNGIRFDLNTHTQGFDYPVAYTDGTHGCTNFTDTLVYNYSDHTCVPNPPSGYFPSVGCCGANDGHLVVVDTSTGNYYDFWKLYTDAAGTPLSTNVGGIASGSLNGNGTPGHTASEITGLAGDILPGELDCVTCLNHALSVIVPGSMNSNQVGTQAPAVKTDGTVSGAIFREGAKIQFDPAIAIASLGASVAVQAILRALQLYGGVITDQTGGSQIAFYSALPSPPDLTGLQLIGQHLKIFY